MRLPLTLHIQTGKKLSDRTKEDIMSEVAKLFKPEHVRAIQICYDTIRVTFHSPEIFKRAKESSGIYIFGLWCNILGGGPPVTVVNLFDFPFEEEDIKIEEVLSGFGEVKRIRHQTYVSCSNIFTGTRLVSIVLKSGCTLPRYISIDSYNCRIWYRGQPLICNLCAVQGHKSANCPNKDKCRRCGGTGHFARACPNPWGNNPLAEGNVDHPADPSAIIHEDSQVVNVREQAGPASGTDAVINPDDVPSSFVQSANESAEVVNHQNASGSDLVVGEFLSQSQDLFPESSESIGSFSDSQSILRNVNVVDKTNVTEETNVADESIVESIVIEESSTKGNDNCNPTPKSSLTNECIENNSSNEDNLMEFDPSGSSRKRCLDEDDPELVSSEKSRPQARRKKVVAANSAAVVSPESVSLESSPGSKNLQTKVSGGVLGKFLPRRKPSPIPVVAKPSQKAGIHSSLPVSVSSRPPSVRVKPKSKS